MDMENIVKYKAKISGLFKILNDIIENEGLDIGVDSDVKSSFFDFICDSLGKEFMIRNNFHLLKHDSFDVIIELLFLKFKNEDFYNSFDFKKHIGISKLSIRYNKYLELKKSIKKEVEDLEYRKRELERELEDLETDWLEELF